MSDLIKREDAIKELTDALSVNGDWYKEEAEDIIKTTLNELPSANDWIPCSERLPNEEFGRYWCCTDGGYQFQARWTNDRFGLGESDKWGWSRNDVTQYSRIVAWQPLPMPYKGKE